VQRQVRRLETLSVGLEAGEQLATILFFSARMRLASGENQAALRIVERLSELTEGIRDWSLRSAVESQAASVLTLVGRFTEADRRYQRCRESYDRAELGPTPPLGMDMLAQAHLVAGMRECLRGRSASARRCLATAVEHTDRLGHPFSQALTRLYGVGVALLERDPEQAWSLLTDGKRFATGVESIGLLAFARMFEPSLESLTPAATDRVARIEQALRDHEQAGYRFLRSLGIAQLARVLEEEGRTEESLATLAAAAEEAAHGEDVVLAPEMQRRRGELLVRLARFGEAEAALRQSLRAARRGEAIRLELRAVLSLARLLDSTGRPAPARRALEEMLARLPGDVDAPERAEAVALRDSLR
jgi:tetratricopeptide (TPR) repeat protein